MGFVLGTWLLLASIAAAQIILPSNMSDLSDPSTSPRFILNATGPVRFPGLKLAPLGQYAYISRNSFLNIEIDGYLVNTDANNANAVQSHDFNFVSCDPEEYEGGNLDVNAVLRIITNQQSPNPDQKSSLIFYSTRSNHCNASGITSLPVINGIFTTVDNVLATQIANMNFTESSNAAAVLRADTGSFGNSPGSGGFNQPSTTAVAMIILYAVTGIITALFVVIIVTGAVRAHRHPERYGPRNSPGPTRQSRAKGIARAMLETLPIVKFGDHHDLPTTKPNTTRDVEMADTSASKTTDMAETKDKSVAITTTSEVTSVPEASGSSPSSASTESPESAKNADSVDESNSLGCSICTEDFQKGEEVRVLPCNHKFHPECVDPWLLNVSGTCPLCRINLSSQDGEGADSNMPPPLNSASPFTDRRSQAIHHLMAIAYGSREERVSALRQYRRNRSAAGQMNEEERVSRARRFREALRIRTREHVPNETEREMRNSGIDAITGSGVQSRL